MAEQAQETTQGGPLTVLTAASGARFRSWVVGVRGLEEKGNTPAEARDRLGQLVAEVLPGVRLLDAA